ncbi:hypothetical protein BRM3_08985 [Brachybacterium huguangmaarense]|uniref:Uncharacterized protein n=1 Tax=Brachybacterium huguangmaarense TaxID=1652028 RepID=A0ABY6FXX2_9MICO|nr:hypothetical protein [Brachybacterium huguangmaarense]UYG15779.1 hypothetical protein BRM3_08985 [Brachybacterium huguangmaarense]
MTGMDSGHESWEFENRVVRLRVELDEVPRLLGEVSEAMLTPGCSAMSMTPRGRSRSAALPGGRALVVLGPVSEHASELDDLPHPVTVVREVADGVRVWMGRPSVPGASLESELAFLRESARWVVAHEELASWVEHRVGEVLGLLRSLVGDVDRPEPRTIEPEEIRGHMESRLREDPAAYRMTPSEAEIFWPGIADRIKAHRSRARARARADSRMASEEAGQRVDVEPAFFAVPDAAGRYGADDLARFDRERGHVRTRRVGSTRVADGSEV